MVEVLDRRVERPLRGERAHVQLVDHRAAHRPAPPAGVRPAEGRVIVGAARAVGAQRLPGRPRVRQRVAAVDPERVVGPGADASGRSASHQPGVAAGRIGCGSRRPWPPIPVAPRPARRPEPTPGIRSLVRFSARAGRRAGVSAARDSSGRGSASGGTGQHVPPRASVGRGSDGPGPAAAARQASRQPGDHGDRVPAPGEADRVPGRRPLAVSAAYSPANQAGCARRSRSARAVTSSFAVSGDQDPGRGAGHRHPARPAGPRPRVKSAGARLSGSTRRRPASSQPW